MTRMNTSDSPLLKLSPRDLPSLLRPLSERYALYVPYIVGDGVRFLPFQVDRPVDLAQTPPSHPMKSVLFPNPEVLFRYTRSEAGDLNLIPAEGDTRELVIFGARSCDVRALSALDAVFLKRSVPDTTYRERRERLHIIGVGCVTPADTCFCDRMGGGPFDDTGMDIMIFPLPDAYILKVLTQQGQALLAPARSLLEEVDEGVRQQVTAMVTRGISQNTGTPVDFAALKKAVESGREDPYWDALADVCLGCGICTFVCPVCSCFSLTDSGKIRGGQRLRTWDACMFPTFTKEASGHNPRGEIVQRVKQRFFHKFYYSLENGEPPGCVGCGRCVAQCPASIDIREIITHFQGEGG